MSNLKACRACLTISGKLEKASPMVRRYFAAITSLEIEETDVFPQYICSECLALLKKAVAFRRRCRLVHFVLKEIHVTNKQVTYKDIKAIDRHTNKLTSAYNVWNPEDSVAFTYTCLVAVENPLEDNHTPVLQQALKESAKERKSKTKYDVNVKTKPIETECKFRSEIFSTHGEFVKHRLNAVNKSSVLVDVKPYGWKEIKEEDQKEEIEILVEISEDKDWNDDPVGSKEIDLGDGFEDLKEKNGQESETEEEVMPTEYLEEENVGEPKTSRASLNSILNRKLRTLFGTNGVKLSAEAVCKSKVRLLSLEEQREQYLCWAQTDPLKSARFKCDTCKMTYKSMEELALHIDYHNTKSCFEFVCRVCEDRFDTEQELSFHAATMHWYEYTCPACQDKHYTLKDLVLCYLPTWTSESTVLAIDKYFTKTVLRQEEMAGTVKPAKKVHSCAECSVVFANRPTLLRHLKRNHDLASKRFTCEVCKSAFRLRTDLISHMEQCHQYRYKCNMCNEIVLSAASAKHHLEIHRKRWCSKCDIFYRKKWQLSNHMLYAHRLSCALCGHGAVSEKDMLLHHLCEHKYYQAIASDVPKAFTPERAPTQFSCEQCRLFFRTEKEHYRHLAEEKHPQVDDYSTGCKDCKVLFDFVDEYRSHLSMCSHRSYPRKCYHCDTVVKNFYDLKRHINRKHGNEQYVGPDKKLCDICGNMVSRYSILAHQKKHIARAGTIECRFCSHKASTVASHVSHVLSSHTRHPYRCTVCGARFVYRTHCREHILKVHAPVKPYSCTSCNLQFAHVDYLNAHCKLAHQVDRKKTDNTVYLSKRMWGKIYVYPYMTVDGSLVEREYLEQVPVYVCDYIDDNEKLIDYKTVFFFDPTVDASKPTRSPKRRFKEKEREYWRRVSDRKRLEQIMDNMETEEEIMIMENDSQDDTNDYDAVAEETQNELTNGLENDITTDNTNTEEEAINESDSHHDDTNDFDAVAEGTQNELTNSLENEIDSDEMEIEYVEDILEDDPIEENSEDVLGQVIEKDGPFYMYVDGMLYEIKKNKM